MRLVIASWLLSRTFLSLGASCAEIWSQHNPPDTVTLASLSERTLLVPTVTYSTTIAGQHGGQRHILKRSGSEWLSVYSPFPNAPQGDPRNIVSLFGEEAARFLGYEIESDMFLTVPDATELNGTIAKLNERLLAVGFKPVRLKFYSVKEEVGPSRYIRRFLTDFALPLAEQSSSLVHDHAFHTRSIFLPDSIWDVLRDQTHFASLFAEYLATLSKQGGHKKMSSENLMLASKLVLMAKLVDIDTATANFSNVGLRFRRNRSASSHDIDYLAMHTNELLYEGVAGLDAIEDFLREHVLGSTPLDPATVSTYRRTVGLGFLSIRRHLSAGFIRQIFTDLIPLYWEFRSLHLKMADEDAGPRLDLNSTELCTAMAKRWHEVVTSLEYLSR